MRFVPSDDQRDFVASLESLLAAADPVAAARAWAEGETAPGLALWRRLAEQGVHALLVPEEAGGMGATPVELVLAFEALGRHAVPGPYVESVAFLPAALGDAEPVAALAEGAVGSVAAPPGTPYCLDADVATHVFVAGDGALRSASVAAAATTSVDRTRRLFEVTPTGDAVGAGDLDAAHDLASLATAAQLLGCGERILADSVDYVKQRRQFGREIGSYQAIKHHLADVRIALDFARPLLHGAALAATGESVDAVPADRARDVSAAKVACADAAYRAARTGLQVHGAIGYTAEFDLSLWLTKVRALVTAWGTPAHHRARVLAALTAAEGGAA
ncbi:acyl-CoA dehydrogenase family protein [Nocardioides ferulae]|uniref:acyl-CoA dehydrogenase family protein n=1 Tax=Nocardioides ferulae TaxID=2340821 RepID=UPI000EAF7697|nr:acyl-CoA dehydrogenase family protein [Nocardioides ferulae]